MIGKDVLSVLWTVPLKEHCLVITNSHCCLARLYDNNKESRYFSGLLLERYALVSCHVSCVFVLFRVVFDFLVRLGEVEFLDLSVVCAL
jgi:hypothetical protein